VTFTFSETVTGFAVGDITVGNGTAGNFAGSGKTYTADITPAAGGAVTVDVAAGVCVDLAGNPNTAATQFSVTSYVVKINDSFSGADGTELSLHTISPTNTPSAVWTNIVTAGGRYLEIRTNTCRSTASNDGYYGLNAGASDVIFDITVKPATDTNIVSVFIRMDNLTVGSAQNNGWAIQFGNGKVELYERSGASPGTLADTKNMTTTGGTAYAIRAVMVGTSIVITVNGANTLTTTSAAHQASTNFGMRLLSSGSTASIVDDFKIFF
jgi:hypothetical protein